MKRKSLGLFCVIFFAFNIKASAIGEGLINAKFEYARLEYVYCKIIKLYKTDQLTQENLALLQQECEIKDFNEILNRLEKSKVYTGISISSVVISAILGGVRWSRDFDFVRKEKEESRPINQQESDWNNKVLEEVEVEKNMFFVGSMCFLLMGLKAYLDKCNEKALFDKIRKKINLLHA